ncbi:glycoside hydrolase family 18 protein [Photorhabdus luminescens]|uniref:chitinase n=1 Tax=Photorhabdus luminescens subsp. mexicana TaxID=2100167 RepID=A0A4R4JJF1_PHOLU|nr:glycoside hydrolase family 18 protein [Photorhabdus luminescens]TDB54414.1 chitinase [Photorhabdus luminescens subsp. mexicana]
MSENEPKADSQLVYETDPHKVKDSQEGAAQKTYRLNGFDPKTTDGALSYTPTRLAKTVFNIYEENDDFGVFCYLSDWSIYDARLVDTASEDDFKKNGGRSADLMRFKGDKDQGKPFKRIIFSFAGIIGDPGEKKTTIIAAAGVDGWQMGNAEQDILENHEGKPIPIDPWADVAAYLNCGFTLWAGNPIDLYQQDKAQGVLGGLRLLRDENPDLEISVSVGGWSMSGAFYKVCRDEKLRQRFVDGVKDLYAKFPMLTHIDLDWEYPGSAGDNNEFDEDDYKYFVELIKDLKNANISNLKGISIAASADIEKIKAAHIPELIAAGVNEINLMTYDFFTLGDGKLSHHTNLYRNKDDQYSKYSVDDAVSYLISLGINKKFIYIGYSGYTRNARTAELDSKDNEQLIGKYIDGTSTVGSFEHGVIEWTDIIYNYVDYENQIGRNGFTVFHDKTAQADYLYNKDLKVFMSLDTPRSVREKGRYVKEKGLGGLFIWSGDQDNGLLTNAAHEGLGRKAVKKVIDMEPFYFDGGGELPSYDKPKEKQCEECKLN